MMADRRSNALKWLYWTARRLGRHKYIMGTERLNQRAVALAMGIHPTTLGRVIRGELPFSAEFQEGMLRFSGRDSLADLWDEADHLPPVPAGAFLNG